MEMNFGNLLKDGLDTIALNLESLSQEQFDPTLDYTGFANFMFIRANLDNIEDREVELNELMKNGFLANFAQGYEFAASNKECDDPHINSIARKIKSVVNNGYLHKDIPDTKMDIGGFSATKDVFFKERFNF